MFSADLLLIKKPCTSRKKTAVRSVLVFEQRTKQRQLNAQMNIDSVCTHMSVIVLKLIPYYSPFIEDIQIGVSDLILDILTNSKRK